MSDNSDSAMERGPLEAEHAKARMTHLQAVTIALAEALTPNQVAEAVVKESVAASSSNVGFVCFLTDEKTHLEVIYSVGYPQVFLDSWSIVPLTVPMPLTEAVQSGVPVFIETASEMEAHYPNQTLAEIRRVSGSQAFAVLPLIAHGVTLGALGLGFQGPHLFAEDERAFLSVIASQCALALERARLYLDQVNARAVAEATQRNMAFLAQANRILTSSLDYETTLRTLANVIVPRLADTCTVDMRDNTGVVRRLAVAHADANKLEFLQELARRFSDDLETRRGISRVLQSGKPEFHPIVTDEALVQAAQTEEELALLRSVGFGSAIIVPLIARDRILGVLTLATTEVSGRHYDESDLALVEELARQAAVTVDNSRLYQSAQEAIYDREATLYLHQSVEARLSLLVEASGKLLGTLKIGEVLPAIMELAQRLISADAYAIWRRYDDPVEWCLVSHDGLSAGFQGINNQDANARNAVPAAPLVISDVFSERMLLTRQETYRREGIRSMLVLPLTIHEEPAGTLVLYYRTQRIFDETEVRVAAALANLAASALSTAELYEEQNRLRNEAQEAAQMQRDFLRDVLASVTEHKLRLCSSVDDLPASRPNCRGWVDVTPLDLGSIRREVRIAAAELRFPDERMLDLLTAVGEASMNAVVHAGGGESRVCIDPDGILQIWVQDHGTGIAVDRLPQATLERGYTTAGTLGHGFKMILGTIDRVWLLTGPEGTTVVIEQERQPTQTANWA